MKKNAVVAAALCAAALLFAACGGKSADVSDDSGKPPVSVDPASQTAKPAPTERPVPAPKAVETPKPAASAEPHGPIDHRIHIKSTNFKPAGEGEWLTQKVEALFPFDEAIYSWKFAIPEGEGMRLHLQVEYPDGTTSPWLYGGYWGTVALEKGRTVPKFEFGSVEMDQLLMTKKATKIQFKATSAGEKPLTVLPDLYVITTDNKPSDADAAKYMPVRTMIYRPGIVLDLPLVCQVSSTGEPMPDRCQSAAMSTALKYFGTELKFEDVVNTCFDFEYDYPGIWPRTIGVATQQGFDAYIDRFRNWEDVKMALHDNKVILCSIRMPKGDYVDPPYASIGGHIVALNGITDDGRVIVTDSALCKRGDGLRCQWKTEDFTKIWMGTKGGVGMVVRPPEGAEKKLFPIENLPEFPSGRPAER